MKLCLTFAVLLLSCANIVGQIITDVKPRTRFRNKEAFTQKQAEKVLWWQTLQTIGLRRKPLEPLVVPLDFNLWGIVQATFEYSKDDSYTQEQSTKCHLTEQTNDRSSSIKMLWRSKDAKIVSSKRLGRSIYFVDSLCTLWRYQLNDATGSSPEKLSSVSQEKCEALNTGDNSSIEQAIVDQMSLINQNKRLSFQNGKILDSSNKLLLSEVSQITYLINQKEQTIKEFQVSTECLFCKSQLYPVEWNLKNQAELMTSKSNLPSTMVALKEQSLVFILLEDQKIYSVITEIPTLFGNKIDTVEVIDDLVLFKSQNNELNMTSHFLMALQITSESITSEKLTFSLTLVETTSERFGTIVGVDSFRRRLLIMDATIELDKRLKELQLQENNETKFLEGNSIIALHVEGIENRKLLVTTGGIAELGKEEGETSLAIKCPIAQSQDIKAEENYFLNITLQHCPEQFFKNLSFDSWCHLSIPIIVRSDTHSDIFSRPIVISLLIVMLITTVILGACLSRSKQEAQNNKLIAEIAQIELDTLKLSVEFSQKIKPPGLPGLDEIGETDFEPYHEY
jgi:hypothetical protein